MRYILSFALLSTFAHAVPASAQPEPQHVEVGVGAGAVFSWFGGGAAIGGGDIRVSAPITDRSMLETIVAATPMDDRYVAGFYGVQLRRRVGRRTDPETQPFITYGLIGTFAHRPGNTFVSPPLIGLIGGGVQQRIAERLAIRLEAQAVMALVLPVGGRAVIGLSVPVGRQGY